MFFALNKRCSDASHEHLFSRTMFTLTMFHFVITLWRIMFHGLSGSHQSICVFSVCVLLTRIQTISQALLSIYHDVDDVPLATKQSEKSSHLISFDISIEIKNSVIKFRNIRATLLGFGLSSLMNILSAAGMFQSQYLDQSQASILVT